MNSTSVKTFQPFRDQLEAAFVQFAARPALTYQDETWTFAELDARTRAAAAHLQRQGLRPGERVMLYTSDKRALLLAHLGAMRAGGVSLPLNFKFTPSEMRYYAADSGSVLAVGGDAELPVLQALVEDQENSLRGVLHADEFLALAPQPTAPLPASTADDWALLLYSSGTTGQPKGVVHTHANLGAAVRSLADCWAFTPDDVLVNVLPFFHIHGLSFASHVNLLTGAHMLMGDQFHPVRTLDLIDRATVFMAIPPMYYQFLNRPEFREHAKQWSHVRLFTCGSAPIRPEVLPELESILKNPLINRYGMTESHVIASLPIDRPSVQGSVGLPLDGVEMTMVEDGSTTKEGHAVGEVHVKGPVIFTHYLNRPEATRRGVCPRGLLCHRRPRYFKSPRVFDSYRKKSRPHHHQGLQRLPAHGRARAQRLSGRKGIRRLRLARRPARREGGGRCGEGPRCRDRGHTPCYPRLLPRTQRGLPGAVRGPLRR